MPKSKYRRLRDNEKRAVWILIKGADLLSYYNYITVIPVKISNRNK